MEKSNGMIWWRLRIGQKQEKIKSQRNLKQKIKVMAWHGARHKTAWQKAQHSTVEVKDRSKARKNKGIVKFEAENKGTVKGKAKIKKKIIEWHGERHGMAQQKVK